MHCFHAFIFALLIALLFLLINKVIYNRRYKSFNCDNKVLPFRSYNEKV